MEGHKQGHQDGKEKQLWPSARGSLPYGAQGRAELCHRVRGTKQGWRMHL